MATIEDFDRLELRVGRILEVHDHPKARKPSYRLLVDLGSLGTRRSVAALKTDYAIEELVGRQVVCVANLPSRLVAGVSSEVLVLAANDLGGRLRLLRPDGEAEPGARVS